MQTMKKNENLDDLIRAKLENYSVPPPPQLWQQVHQKLEYRRRQTKMMWVRITSAAAVVAIAFIAGWYFVDTRNDQPVISETNPPESRQEMVQTPASGDVFQAETNKSAENNLPGTATNPSLLAAKTEGQSAGVDSEQPAVIADLRSSASFEKMQSRNSRFENDPFPKLKVKRQPAIYDELALADVDKLIIESNIRNLENEKTKPMGWTMGLYVAPGYSSYNASHTSDYKSNMTYSGSEGNTNVGGGVSVQYRTGKRWMVESGVYYAQNGQKSENSVSLFAFNQNYDYAAAPESNNYFSNVVRVNNGNLAMNSTAGVIAFSGTPKGAELSGSFESLAGNKTNMMVPNGEFSQVFEFMEIPMLVRYRVIDSRFGVEVIAGLSTSVLVGNNAYIDNQYGTQNIGKTLDISTFNLAGNAGLAANYALGDHFSVAIEPRFSYYLNSINQNSQVEFRPYRIGFFTGLTYNF
jgi:hypothetical protein